MNTAQHIIKTLTVRRIARALGVGGTAVYKYDTPEGKLPPGWFPVVRDLCAAEGIDCPMDAFAWKAPANAGTKPAEIQVTECNGAPSDVAKVTVGGGA